MHIIIIIIIHYYFRFETNSLFVETFHFLLERTS